MRKRFNTLNEEINRMKSLFTEERMFGNLVTESVIKVGSKGDGVKALQSLLGIKSDGIFGPKTKEEVIKMQKEVGVNADGVVGPKTMDAINKKYNIILKEDFISEGLPDPTTTHGMMDFLQVMNKEINNKIIDKEKTEEKQKEEKGETERFGSEEKPVKGSESETSSTTVTKDKDGTETTVTTGKDGKTSSTTVTKGEKGGEKSGEGGDDKKGTYDDQNKGSEEEGEAKAGTKRKGTEFYQKGKSKNTVKTVLASVKATKGEINDNVKACKNGMKQLYKQIVKIGDANLELTENELEGLDWCMSTFKNRFEKLGFGIGREEAEEIYDTLNREIPELKDTVEGEKYDVKDDSDLVVAKLKRLGPGKYSFNGRKGYIIATKDRKDGRMKISGDFQKYLLRTLKKDSNNWKIVTISKKTGKNNGQFLVRKK